jgi:chitosanase
MTDVLRARILAIHRVFENARSKLQYDSVEDLGFRDDFFCTASDDLVEVLHAYQDQQSINSLASEAFEQFARDKDTAALKGLMDGWNDSMNDHKLRQIRRALLENFYWEPCLEYCEKLDLQLPISKAVLYDTMLQHGDGNDPDSLGAILSSIDTCVEEGEAAWLSEFLYHRQNILEHACNEDVREVWKESAVWVEALFKLLEENPQLESKVVISTKYFEAVEVLID